MLKHPELTKDRLARFARELKERLYVRFPPVNDLSVFSAPDRISYSKAINGSYCPASERMQFGPVWSTHLFRIGYEIPDKWKSQDVFLHFDSTSEGCVWKNGLPIQGLTNFIFGPHIISAYQNMKYLSNITVRKGSKFGQFSQALTVFSCDAISAIN
ncbi:MAG: hypothetical protein ACFUZC_10780 [Chthoniobacteraceae bacterium]